MVVIDVENLLSCCIRRAAHIAIQRNSAERFPMAEIVGPRRLAPRSRMRCEENHTIPVLLQKLGNTASLALSAHLNIEHLTRRASFIDMVADAHREHSIGFATPRRTSP